MSEFYEEIVFQDPTALMQHLLSSSKPVTLGVWRHNTDCMYKSILSQTIYFTVKERYNFTYRIAICSLFGANNMFITVEAKKESTMKAIMEARNKIRLEVIDLKEKLTLAKETIAKFKEEIAKISKAGGGLVT